MDNKNRIYTIYQQGVTDKKKNIAIIKEIVAVLYEFGDDSSIIDTISDVCINLCQKPKEVEFFLSTYLKYVGESGDQLTYKDADVFEYFQNRYSDSSKITKMLADVYAVLAEHSEVYSEKLEHLSLTNVHIKEAVWVNAQDLILNKKDNALDKYESYVEKIKGYVEKYGEGDAYYEFDRLYATGLSNLVKRDDINRSKKDYYLAQLRSFEEKSSSKKVGANLLEALYFYLKGVDPSEMNAILDEMRTVYHKHKDQGIKCFFLCYGIAYQVQFLNKEQAEESIREIESFADVWSVASKIAYELRNNIYEF